MTLSREQFSILSYDGEPPTRRSDVRATLYSFCSYDDAGNLTGVDSPGTVMDVTLQYDAHNRVTNMVDGIGTTTNSYWPGGRLKSEAGPWKGVSS